MSEHTHPATDWELSDTYYQSDDTKPKLNLQDFMEDEESSEDSSSSPSAAISEPLQRTIKDVHEVMTMALQGAPIEKIAQTLNLAPQYVYNIQITAQGFHEDDEIAVAHLLMME